MSGTKFLSVCGAMFGSRLSSGAVRASIRRSSGCSSGRGAGPLLCRLALMIVAIGCSKPVEEGQGGGPEPFLHQQAPFLEPQAPFLPPKVEVPSTCGDPAIRARFEACKAAAGKHEQAPCEAAGGTWGRIGLHEGCDCPTGQGDCPCTRAEDCLAECVSYANGRGCPEAKAAGTWRCAAYHDVVGCHCFLDHKGEMGSICVD